MSSTNSSIIAHRNARARESRRQKNKGECDCDSVPRSCAQSDRQERKLTLKENFGWRVVEMTHVESSFPQLTRYYEKPGASGQFEKVTHVLCMGKPATVVGRRPARPENKEAEAAKPGMEKKEEEAVKPDVEKKEEAATQEVDATDTTWKSLLHSTQPSAVSWGTLVTSGSGKSKEAQVDSKPKRKDTPYRPHLRSSSKSKNRSPRGCEGGEPDRRLETARDALLRRLREEKETRRSMCSDTVRMSAAVDERKRATRVMFDQIDSGGSGRGGGKARKEEKKKEGKGKPSKLVERGSSVVSRKMAKDRLESTDSRGSEGSSDVTDKMVKNKLNRIDSRECEGISGVTGKKEKREPLRAGSSEPRLKNLRGEMKMIEGTVEYTERKKLADRRSPARRSVSKTSSGSKRGKKTKILEETIVDVKIKRTIEKSPMRKISSGCHLKAGAGETDAVLNGKAEKKCLAKEELERKDNVQRKPKSLVNESSRSVSRARDVEVDPSQNLALENRFSKLKKSFYTEGTARKELRERSKCDGGYSSGQNVQERTYKSMRKKVTRIEGSGKSLESLTNHDKASEKACKSKTKKIVGESLTNADRIKKEKTGAVFSTIESRYWDYDEVLKWKKERQRVGSGSVANKSSGRKGNRDAEPMIVMRPEELKLLDSVLTVTEIDLGDGENYEQLLKTPSGSNKYLYVPNKR